MRSLLFIHGGWLHEVCGLEVALEIEIHGLLFTHAFWLPPAGIKSRDWTVSVIRMQLA